MTVTPLKVNLPDPEHSHFDPVANRFVTHSHPHDGLHRHADRNGHVIVVHEPGNYSPRAAR